MGLHMDNFEEIGRRIDAEMERLRHYVDEEIAPETEKRTASFLRDVSGKLDQFAQKLRGADVAAEFAGDLRHKLHRRRKIRNHERGSIVMVEIAAEFPYIEMDRVEMESAMVGPGGVGLLRGDFCDGMRRAAAGRERAASDEYDS